MTSTPTSQDALTPQYLARLQDLNRAQPQRVAGVKTVLVVLSAAGMVFDTESLRQKIHGAYPDAAIFFISTQGHPVGPWAPQRVDLLIDLTGPSQKQGWFYARKLRKIARVAVGRNAGLFRKRIYDRIVDEKLEKNLPNEKLERERWVQKAVLELAGVSFLVSGDSAQDRGKITPLELPPFAQLS